jgi:hypothetical protein
VLKRALQKERRRTRYMLRPRYLANPMDRVFGMRDRMSDAGTIGRKEVSRRASDFQFVFWIIDVFRWEGEERKLREMP